MAEEAQAEEVNAPQLWPWLVVEQIYGSLPTQADGQIMGFPFYFRSRHGAWGLWVSKPDVDPCSIDNDEAVYFAEGKDDYNGCMPNEEVFRLLAHHCMIMKDREDKLKEIRKLA